MAPPSCSRSVGSSAGPRPEEGHDNDGGDEGERQQQEEEEGERDGGGRRPQRRRAPGASGELRRPLGAGPQDDQRPDLRDALLRDERAHI